MENVLNPLRGNQFSAQTTTYTGTAGTVTGWPFAGQPLAVLVWSTSDAYIAVGSGVTATTTNTPIPAFTPVKFKVPANTSAGDGAATTWTVSAIQISAGGSVYAKPLES